MRHPELTSEQQAEADRLYQALRGAVEDDLRALCAFLATKDDRHLFGQTEFEVRDRVLAVGAKALAAAAAARKKTATTAPAASAPTAGRPPSSSAGRPSAS